MFCCTEPERAQRRRLEDAYRLAMTPVMKAIERRVCGGDYGGNSWTSRAQADALVPLLGLGAGTGLVDLGAGTGWPALYLAEISGCSAMLVDLPETALRIARERAGRDGLADRVTTRVADAADLPFAAGSFDAVTHSDLLCCLVRKRRVLEECRRIVRAGGRMVFTVISLAPGLSPAQHARALENAPEFVETDTGYGTLLRAAGWDVVERTDLTDAYRESCARQIEADCDNRGELAELLGEAEANTRLDGWRAKLRAIEEGLFVRELYLCASAER